MSMTRNGRQMFCCRLKAEHIEDLRLLAFWQNRSRQDLIDEIFSDYIAKVGVDHRKGQYRNPAGAE